MKSKEIIKTVSTPHSKFNFRNDLVLEIMLAETHFTIKESKEVNQNIIKITNGIPCKVLVEAGDLTMGDSESREWATTKEACKPMLALAIVTKSLPQKLIANFIMNVQKPIIPTKVFTKKEEAELWLSSF